MINQYKSSIYHTKNDKLRCENESFPSWSLSDTLFTVIKDPTGLRTEDLSYIRSAKVVNF